MFPFPAFNHGQDHPLASYLVWGLGAVASPQAWLLRPQPLVARNFAKLPLFHPWKSRALAWVSSTLAWRPRTLVSMALLVLLALVSSGHQALAEGIPSSLPLPGPRDTCPVCGMFVAKYPHWVATVVYRDGHAHHFDGAKDLFKYLFDLPRWAPGHQAMDMVAIAVTEYYGLKRIPAREAWFVIGSDVPGPMGQELVPLGSAAEAQEFLRDHGGKRILRFDEVTPDLPARLDEGRFD